MGAAHRGRTQAERLMTMTHRKWVGGSPLHVMGGPNFCCQGSPEQAAPLVGRPGGASLPPGSLCRGDCNSSPSSESPGQLPRARISGELTASYSWVHHLHVNTPAQLGSE